MIFAQLAATLRARGVTVSAHLQELYRRYVVLSVGVIASLFVNKDMDFLRSVIRDIAHAYHLTNSGKTSNSYFICIDPIVIEKIFSKIRSSGDMV